MTFLEDIKRRTRESKKREEAKQNKLLKKELNSIISHIVKAAKRGEEYFVWKPCTEKKSKMATTIEEYFKDSGFSVKTSMECERVYTQYGERRDYHLICTISWEE